MKPFWKGFIATFIIVGFGASAIVAGFSRLEPCSTPFPLSIHSDTTKPKIQITISNSTPCSYSALLYVEIRDKDNNFNSCKECARFVERFNIGSAQNVFFEFDTSRLLDKTDYILYAFIREDKEPFDQKYALEIKIPFQHLL